MTHTHVSKSIQHKIKVLACFARVFFTQESTQHSCVSLQLLILKAEQEYGYPCCNYGQEFGVLSCTINDIFASKSYKNN